MSYQPSRDVPFKPSSSQVMVAVAGLAVIAAALLGIIVWMDELPKDNSFLFVVVLLIAGFSVLAGAVHWTMMIDWSTKHEILDPIWSCLAAAVMVAIVAVHISMSGTHGGSGGHGGHGVAPFGGLAGVAIGRAFAAGIAKRQGSPDKQKGLYASVPYGGPIAAAMLIGSFLLFWWYTSQP